MTLATYITNTLGSLVDYLNWTVSQISFVQDETLEKYGVSTEGEATDLNKLHALARVETWKRVLAEVSQDYAFSADGGSYSRNQVYEMAKGNLETALNEALVYLPNYSIETGLVNSDTEDPYSALPYYLRTL